MNGQVRIIGGQWRGRKLAVPQSESLRPTPNRVRETLFNWLGQTLSDQTCLDLFSGSGALGFEAASRGAARVVMVEQAPKVVELLQQHAQTLGSKTTEIIQIDAWQWLKSNTETFDIIFLDPPFHKNWVPELLPLLPPLLKSHGVVYCETMNGAPYLAGWHVLKRNRAGQVHYELLARAYEH